MLHATPQGWFANVKEIFVEGCSAVGHCNWSSAGGARRSGMQQRPQNGHRFGRAGRRSLVSEQKD
jgi:hypothetical protein